MYILCKIRTNESNGSIGGHPFDIIKRSESIDEIFTEIKKRIRDSCPTDKLKIMQEVKFTMSVDLKLGEEKPINDWKNWERVGNGIYRYMIDSVRYYEIRIESSGIENDVLTACASLHRVEIATREILKGYGTIKECLEIAEKDFDKENKRNES